MARYTIFVHVMPRGGVLDPPGEATRAALAALGFSGVEGVRIGRRIAVDLDAPGPQEAVQQVEAMARRLLANPVVEEFEVRLGADDAAAPAGGGSRAPGKAAGR